jgi:NADPH-dependent curcumin reductase CurA
MSDTPRQPGDPRLAPPVTGEGQGGTAAWSPLRHPLFRALWIATVVSNVGSFAVQLARWRGIRVIGTSSAHHLHFVRGRGADEVIDYRATRFEEVVRDIDAVFDTVGGETLTRSWGVLKSGGVLVTIATPS